MPHLRLQSRALPPTIDTLPHLRPSTLMRMFMRHLSRLPGWLRFLSKALWSLSQLAPQDPLSIRASRLRSPIGVTPILDTLATTDHPTCTMQTM
jgi:hypothetical protein